MKKRLIITALSTYVLIGCSGEPDIISKQGFFNRKAISKQQVSEIYSVETEKMETMKNNNFPISEEVFESYIQYKQFCTCIKILLKV